MYENHFKLNCFAALVRQPVDQYQRHHYQRQPDAQLAVNFGA